LDWEKEVRDLWRRGAKADALRLVTARLQRDPWDVTALVWFAGLTEDREKALAALRYVLRLDPQNAAARKGLAAMGALSRGDIRVAEAQSLGDGTEENGRKAEVLRVAKKNGRDEADAAEELIRGSQIFAPGTGHDLAF